MSFESVINISLNVLFGLVGVVSLYLVLRRKKYPKRIEFDVLDLVRIIGPTVHKYDSVKLMHNDKETQNVSFMRCMCMNVGDEDVALLSETKKDGLQIELPSDYQWLEAHVQERTKGLDVDLAIDKKHPNVLNVRSTLFKRDEVFTFDAYFDAKRDERLKWDDIKINHRISDADKVSTHYVSMARSRMRKWDILQVGASYVFLLIVMCMVAFSSVINRPFRYVDKNDIEAVYSAKLLEDNVVAVSSGRSGVMPWNYEEYAIDEFNDKFEVKATRSQMSISTMIIFLIVLFGLALLIFCDLGYRYGKYRREKKVLDIYNEIVKKNG